METLIPEKDFKQISSFIYDHSGIDLPNAKRAMVSARLTKRLRHYKLETFAEYFKIVMAPDNSQERQILIDLLTTNETFFFREMAHFDFLRDEYLPTIKTNQAIRLWSAASSSGEEAYSIAMLLADVLGINNSWNVFGSDICTQVIETARSAHYSMDRIDGIPPRFLKKYCLKGTGDYQGTLLIEPELQNKVSFSQVNLNTTLPNTNKFDVIFLRNVLFYFNLEIKTQIVNRVASQLKPGGYFIISHAETVKGICKLIEQVKPSIYKKL